MLLRLEDTFSFISSFAEAVVVIFVLAFPFPLLLFLLLLLLLLLFFLGLFNSVFSFKWVFRCLLK